MKEKVAGWFMMALLLWGVIVSGAVAYAAAEKPEIFVQLGHSGQVSSVAFSPNGQFVLSGSGDKTMRLWNVASGKEIRIFAGHTKSVHSVAFSPDGRFALSGSLDENLHLWNVATGKIIWSSAHTDPVVSVAFSPDGRFALSGSSDKTLRLWDVATGQKIRSFVGHTAIVSSVVFSPDGRFALSGSWDKTMRLWNVATGKELRLFDKHTENDFEDRDDMIFVNSVAFSPDGRFALSGSGDRTMSLWNVASGKEIRSFAGHTKIVKSVSFSPDGRFALSGSGDKTLRLWDVATGKEIRSFAGHAANVFSVVFSPDGRFALSGSGDKTLRLWDVATGKEIRSFARHADSVYSVAFSPDGRFALSGSDDKTMRLWDIRTGEELRSFPGFSEGVYSVAFSPDGRFVLSGCLDKNLRLWNVATGKDILSFAGHTKSVYSVAFSPDGRFVLSGGGDETMRLWDMATGKEIRKFVGHTAPIWSVAFSPDGKYVLSGSSDATLRLWDVTTGKEIRSFVGHTADVTSVSFSPDGRFVLSGSWDTTTRIWDVNTGKEIAQFIGFTDGEWIAITPEGYFNASANGAKHLNVRVGNAIYSIDNFYERFFNPVYVASVLQGKEVKALADIRQGILLPPEVRITSPQPNTSFSTDTIKITVAAQDKGGGIDEIRLYHNGKAIGEEARTLKRVSKDSAVEKTYTVTLVDGMNTFRATGFSKDRTESNPYELVVKLTAPQKEATLHVFAVGLNKYRNPALNLSYAEPDARGIVAFFQEKGTRLFKDVKVTEIFNEEATKATILAKMKELQRTNPQDVVLIYLAGHGDTIDDKWYFIPHELAYPEREEDVKTKGISSVELADYVRQMKATKVLVAIDSCKAGAMLIAFRGFEDRKALSQLSRSSGVHVIAAATKDQFAAETKELGHGVFTYTLLEGLKGKAAGGTDTVTVRKLMGYVEEQLPELTKKYKREAQFPVVNSQGMDFPLVTVK